MGSAPILKGSNAAKSCLTYFFLGACARLPLERGKKVREVLRETGLLHRFFQRHRYDIGTEFPHAFPKGTKVATEPLLNTLDVSTGFVPQRCSPGVVCGTPVPVSVLSMDQTWILLPQSVHSSHPSPLPAHDGGPRHSQDTGMSPPSSSARRRP